MLLICEINVFVLAALEINYRINSNKKKTQITTTTGQKVRAMAINSHRKRVPSCNFSLALFTPQKRFAFRVLLAHRRNYSQVENLCAAPWKLNGFSTAARTSGFLRRYPILTRIYENSVKNYCMPRPPSSPSSCCILKLLN